MGSHRRSRSRSRDRDRHSRRDRDDREGRREKGGYQDRSRERDGNERKGQYREKNRERERDHPKNESERYGLKMMEVKKEENKKEEVKEKEGINLGLSGALTEDKNTFNGVVIKYAEPPEARLPKRRWRFYVFKGEEVLPTLHLHRQSAYLIGKDRKVNSFINN